MKPYNSFFFILLSFLVGVFLADIHCSILVILNISFLSFLFLIFFLEFGFEKISKEQKKSLILIFLLCLIVLVAAFFYYYFYKNHLIFHPLSSPKFLINFKKSCLSNFKSFFPLEESAFISSVLFRERNMINPEFKKDLIYSGTYHLTSFSGLHLTTIIFLSSEIFFFLLTPLNFILNVLLIIFFLLIIGFHPSVMRAAIMGLAYLVSQLLSYKTKPRNVIILTAFLIIFFNPGYISDLGFQLSFISILGIIYLKPALIEIFPKLSPKIGFFRTLKDFFLTTTSAIFLTTPLIIMKGLTAPFIPLAILANLLILYFIPLTILLSLVLGIFSFISYYLGLTLSWFIYILLKYEVFTIKFFGKIGSNFTFSLNYFIIGVYYLIPLIIFIIANEKRRIEKRYC